MPEILPIAPPPATPSATENLLPAAVPPTVCYAAERLLARLDRCDFSPVIFPAAEADAARLLGDLGLIELEDYGGGLLAARRATCPKGGRQ